MQLQGNFLGSTLGPSCRPYIPADEEGCFLWLRSDLGITLNGFGATVQVWANQGTAGSSFSQGTASQQPGYNATGINNWPSLSWSQAAKTWMGTTTITNAASDYLAFFACTPTLTQAATGIWLMDDVTGRLIFTQANLASPNGRVAFFNNASYQGNVLGTTGPQILTFELISGGTTNANIYRNGTSIAASLNYNTQLRFGGAPTSNIALGSSNLGGAGWFEGQLYEVIVLNKTGTDIRQRVEKYLGARYGIAVP